MVMNDVQGETLQRLARMETKVDNMDEKLDRAISASETAVAALASAKSAHHRLDKMESSQQWVWRTIAGTVITVIIAAIIGAIKLGG